MLKREEMPEDCFDIAIIGAGIIGAAIARGLALEGARVAVLEKAMDPLGGASKGNSAILHTGFDAPVGSLEQQCVARGREIYLTIREDLGLPLHETGAMVLAWSDQEAEKLSGLLQQAHENGVDDAAWIDRNDILAREPALSDRVIAGFEVPGEHIIDPWTTPYAYLTQALAHGASFIPGAEIMSARRDNDIWSLNTLRGCIKAKAVVNAAGLYGDIVEERLLGTATFKIKPRKGQFVIFDKAAARHLRSIILPVPNDRTKGVVLCRTIFGNILVGPTAEEQDSREDASVERETLLSLRAQAIDILPALADSEVTSVYAGIRPATERKEYRIIARPDMGYVNIGGIRSTGLSAALGLAEHIIKTHGDALGAQHFANPPVSMPEKIALQHLSDYHQRDWQRPGNGGIICHCEKVTHRDIQNALAGPLAPRSFAGLKRRTRVCMGTCQGFYCMAAVAAATGDVLDVPICVEGQNPHDR